MPIEKETSILTVATVREGRDGEEILFNERQEIFKLAGTVRAGDEVLSRLRGVIKKSEPVRAVLNPKRGVVEKIETPDPDEAKKFLKERVLEKEPSKSVKINVREIDPTVFNVVNEKLKWGPFNICQKIVPNYAKAKEIFDFCAKQSCHLPGPYDISPCIPFQYVIDGCYARAHKMRWIITNKYKYCCEKVFSFANQNSDHLAVKADKWGGCCIGWWYHVAPLIRVKVKLIGFSFTLAYVIDPSMFDKPVLLSTWLAAQENTTCDPSANVSMYSIQPGSAYSPANYQGTQFTTDPDYSKTDSTLLAYANLTSC
ncbi:MAG: protein-glutamine glutaminase family protein [Acidobacteriota bacterium]|nr:protein-glutamine glutaminase family protein [Acidobacteriota bacterium]